MSTTITVEEHEPLTDRPSCVVTSVYLGEFYVGGVHQFYGDDGETLYYSGMCLPMQLRRVRKQLEGYDLCEDTPNKQEALDNLLGQVRQWIKDAGLMPAVDDRVITNEGKT